ncbi:hypothetical protein [Clostridioides difficile]|uniref:hypothetical protein n=1 Tax=Clostridioides difficile TaxID=1496 RepID=UPI000AA4AEE7|nr:hypothetical protein [Clostridioides difficile]
MINLWKKEDLNLLLEYPKGVVENVDNVINILGENYGFNRKVTDDGGYVCIIEDIKDVEHLNNGILKVDGNNICVKKTIKINNETNRFRLLCIPRNKIDEI